MSAKRKKLSIVCPAYEEEEGLPLFHAELGKVLVAVEPDYDVEIIYVDDGSRDRTLQVLHNLANQDPRVRYLSLSRNFGKDSALFAGLEYARGDLIITMDSDLQHPPRLIPLLLAKAQEGFEVVVTMREEKRPSPLKRLSARWFYRLLWMFSDTAISPKISDYQLLTRKVLTQLVQLRERHRFSKGLVQWLGFPEAAVPFRVDQRRAGQSKFTFKRLLTLASDSIFSFSRAPLRLALYLGFAVVLFSVLLSGFWISNWWWSPNPISAGWMYLIISTHLLAGCILCALGVLGEYVGRIFEQVKGRPLYVVKETCEGRSAALHPATRETQRDAA